MRENNNGSKRLGVGLTRYYGALCQDVCLTEFQGIDSARYREAWDVAKAFIVQAVADNPCFSRARFLNACGLCS